MRNVASPHCVSCIIILYASSASSVSPANPPGDSHDADRMRCTRFSRGEAWLVVLQSLVVVDSPRVAHGELIHLQVRVKG